MDAPDIARPKTGSELSHEGGQPPLAVPVRHAQHSQREGLMSHSSCSEPKQRKRNHRPAHDEIFSCLSAKSSQRRECFTLLSDVSILISLTSTSCLPHSSTLAHHVLQCPHGVPHESCQSPQFPPYYPLISLASRQLPRFAPELHRRDHRICSLPQLQRVRTHVAMFSTLRGLSPIVVLPILANVLKPA